VGANNLDGTDVENEPRRTLVTELTPSDIRRLVDQRPPHGYRRIAALLNRERRSTGLDTVHDKRVYRLMKKYGLLLQRHTGGSPGAIHSPKLP
jgi:HTH-like domain